MHSADVPKSIFDRALDIRKVCISLLGYFNQFVDVGFIVDHVDLVAHARQLCVTQLLYLRRLAALAFQFHPDHTTGRQYQEPVGIARHIRIGVLETKQTVQLRLFR